MRNRRIWLTGALVGVVALCVTIRAPTAEFSGGYFHRIRGGVQKVRAFHEPFFPNGVIEGRYEGNRISIPTTDVKEIIWTGPREMTVTLRAGRVYRLSGCWPHHDQRSRIRYEFWDEINQKWSTGTVLIGYPARYEKRCNKVVFGQDIGDLKKCPKCKSYFPQDFLFCPYDKSDLIWSSKR